MDIGEVHDDHPGRGHFLALEGGCNPDSALLYLLVPRLQRVGAANAATVSDY